MANCKECKEKRSVERTPENVPYIVHEAAMARNEKSVKRFVVALVVAIFLIFASNSLWLWAWTQYDYSSEETIYTQDGEGTNIIGDGNEVNNGAEGSY